MTSGTFIPFPVAEIVVGSRQREETLEIDALADSIRRLGLIHPLLVTRNGELIAGERRLNAVKALGWTHVPVQFEDQPDLDRLLALELEENIKRVDLTWQERCKAIQQYHLNRKSETENWTEKDTGAALGLSQPSINGYLMVADNLDKPEVANAPKASTALGLVKRAAERAQVSAIKAINDSFGAPEPTKLIEVADFNEWVQSYTGPKFNLIHCDFPYGINADKMQQGYTPGEFGGYKDDLGTYTDLLESLCDNIDRIAEEQCHLVFWFSMNYYKFTIDFIEHRSNFEVQPFPLVWIKADGSGLLPDPQRGPRRIYETALLASRGDRKIVRAVANAIVSPPSREIHMSEKPQAMLEHFFRMLVDSSTSLLDPTAGSGSALRAARALGASRVFGLEKNPEFADRANARLG